MKVTDKVLNLLVTLRNAKETRTSKTNFRVYLVSVLKILSFQYVTNTKIINEF
jgi:hypothetical protein